MNEIEKTVILNSYLNDPITCLIQNKKGMGLEELAQRIYDLIKDDDFFKLNVAFYNFKYELSRSIKSTHVYRFLNKYFT